MDYTKDAILIRKEFHSLEEDETEENYPSKKSIDILSTLYLSNSSEILEKKLDETGLRFVEGGNGSLFFPSSSLIPFQAEGKDGGGDFNDTMDYIPMSMRLTTYIVPVLFAIIFIIGVIGNGTLIVIFIKHRFMRNVPNMFIVSLAIGDLLLILFCVPFTSTLYTVDSWPYGLVVCKFSEFTKDLSVGVSVFTLTALSADRYFAIVDPMRKLTGRRATRITIISIMGIWALSILVALPSALYSYIRIFPELEGEELEQYEEEDGRTFQVCYPYPTKFGKAYAQVMVMFHFLVYYAIPLFFIATFYIIMARHLVLSTRNMPGEAQGQVKQIQARKKVAKMILSFVVIFAICFFPHHLFLLWFYFYPDAENSFNAFWNICRIVGFCLSFMNSCINPITLYCVSGTFRKQYNEHLFCCFCDKTGGRNTRGGRLSHRGTLAGAGGGNSGNGGGLCAACVTGNSGNNMYGNDNRYGNETSRGGNLRMHRGSTWESSDRTMSKRKSTWETQTTMVNHRVVNLSGAVNGSANIHINLCSEHEHIPLKSFKQEKQATVEQNLKGTVITTRLVEGGNGLNLHNHHQRCYSAKCKPQNDQNFHGHDHIRPPSRNSSLEWKDEQHLSHKLDASYPTRIEEETSEHDSGGKFVSPTRSCADNFWQNSTTPSDSETCLSSEQRNLKKEAKSIILDDCEELHPKNNNNDYSGSNAGIKIKRRREEEDQEYAIVIAGFDPERKALLASNLGKSSNPIMCYN